MGNCLVLQESIKIMKTDGKILEYKAPMQVHQILSKFPGHAMSDTLPVHRHLRPESEILGGHLYYLLPLPMPSPAVGKKVRFSSCGEESEPRTGVRIKLVITKQELKEMLSKGGFSAGDLVCQLPNKQSINRVDKFEGDVRGQGKEWKPLLESIPESD